MKMPRQPAQAAGAAVKTTGMAGQWHVRKHCRAWRMTPRWDCPYRYFLSLSTNPSCFSSVSLNPTICRFWHVLSFEPGLIFLVRFNDGWCKPMLLTSSIQGWCYSIFTIVSLSIFHCCDSETFIYYILFRWQPNVLFELFSLDEGSTVCMYFFYYYMFIWICVIFSPTKSKWVQVCIEHFPVLSPLRII